MLANFDWKAIVRADLEGMPDKIDVIEQIREAMPCFRRMYAWILKFRCEELTSDIETIREMCETVENEQGDPYLLECDLDGAGGLSNISYQPIPVNLAHAIRDGEAIERVVERLKRAVAADEPSTLSNPAGYSIETREAVKVGAALLEVYFQSGGSGEPFQSAVHSVIDGSDGDIGPLIGGMTVIAAVALSMAGSALGTSAQDIAGGLLRTNG